MAGVERRDGLTIPFDTRQVLVFLALAEELNFSRTGDRLGLTPSRVSQVVRALEERIGGELFTRTSRTVRLTSLGAAFRDDLAPAFGAVQQALDRACDRARGVAGTLRLAMYSSATGGPRPAEILRGFEAAHRDCQVELVDTHFNGDVAERLSRGEADVLATRLPHDDPDFVVGPELSREPRVVLVAADHDLATRDSISYEELADYVVTDHSGFSRPLLDSVIPPRTPSGRALKRKLLNGTMLQIWAEIRAKRIVHPSVPSMLEHYPQPGIVAVPINDLPDSTTALVWHRDRETAAVRALAEVAARIVPQPAPA